jgi:hypothetical protein
MFNQRKKPRRVEIVGDYLALDDPEIDFFSIATEAPDPFTGFTHRGNGALIALASGEIHFNSIYAEHCQRQITNRVIWATYGKGKDRRVHINTQSSVNAFVPDLNDTSKWVKWLRLHHPRGEQKY